MASMLRVTGVTQVRSKMRVAAVSIGKLYESNLKRAGLFIQHESQKIVPVDTGNLKNSAFTRNVGGSGWAADVIVGYTANYAVYVHENLEAKHKEGKSAKFLERVIRSHGKQVVRIVGDSIG